MKTLIVLPLWFLALSIPFQAQAASSETYKYDALGRVVRVETTAGRITTYTYDAAGNRAGTVTTGGLAAPPRKVVVLPLLGGLVIPLP